LLEVVDFRPDEVIFGRTFFGHGGVQWLGIHEFGRSSFGAGYRVGHQGGSTLGRGETQFEQLPEHNTTLVSQALAS
jgi:hypothetical protein